MRGLKPPIYLQPHLLEHKCDQTVTSTGAQFEGNLGEILALGAEISPYIGLREKWESPLKKKKKKKKKKNFFFFFKFSSCQHTIDKL